MKQYLKTKPMTTVKLRKNTPQSMPIPGKENKMEKNDAGGYSFTLDKWSRLLRFLILGTENGTYYASAEKLTTQNTSNLQDCIKSDGKRVVDMIAEVAREGRSKKYDQLLFALALCAKTGNDNVRAYANQYVESVCNIGTHILHYANFINSAGGWGSGTKRSIQRWYNNTPTDKLAYQLVKYQSRDGFSHADVLRLAHPKPVDEPHDYLFAWAANKIEFDGKNYYLLGNAGKDQTKTKLTKHEVDLFPEIVHGFEMAKKAKTGKEIISLIEKYNLPRECVPTEFLNDKNVWMALLEKMPITATIRNLGKMTSLGILDQRSEGEKTVLDRFGNIEILKKGKIHPITVLLAWDIYSQGHGDKGKLTWKPNRRIIDALEDAFYNSFKNVEPTGKSFCLGIDVSGSMSCAQFGAGNITACKAAAAMAMVIARTEKDYYMGGFCHQFVDLNITAKMNLDSVMNEIQKNNFGATDAAIPINYALKNKHKFDVFMTFSDGESWAGQTHTSQALNKYRNQMHINSKLICCNFTAIRTTLADPSDRGSLNTIGLDPSVPEIVRDFVLEKI